MKNVGIVGVLLLVLGLLSFIVAVPRSENQGVKIGDTKIGLQTQSSEKLPPGSGSAGWRRPRLGPSEPQDLAALPTS
jgi:hypothetical protein